MGQIPAAEWETYEVLILTGQVAELEIVYLMRDNPEFAEWYRERAKERFQRKGAQR